MGPQGSLSFRKMGPPAMSCGKAANPRARIILEKLLEFSDLDILFHHLVVSSRYELVIIKHAKGIGLICIFLFIVDLRIKEQAYMWLE